MSSARLIYFADHHMRTSTWDDLRPLSTVDVYVLQYKGNYRRKIVYFQS